MTNQKITLNELNTLVKKIINEEIKNASVDDQKKWSDEKGRMYDAYVDASNKLLDLKDELKRAKGRKDKEDIKRIQLRIKNNTFAKEFAEEKFNEL